MKSVPAHRLYLSVEYPLVVVFLTVFQFYSDLGIYHFFERFSACFGSIATKNPPIRSRWASWVALSKASLILPDTTNTSNHHFPRVGIFAFLSQVGLLLPLFSFRPFLSNDLHIPRTVCCLHERY